MPPQDEWKALENRYSTPPTYEDPRKRARRASNRERARSRLQQHQNARAVRVQSEAAQSAGVSPPRVELTYIERVVILAVLRLRNFVRILSVNKGAKRLYCVRSVAWRTGQLLDAFNCPRPHSVCEKPLPSYEQLTAAILNLSSEVPAYRADDEGFPSYDQLVAALRNLSPATTLSEHGPDGYPTYEQLASAFRNLTPDVPTQDEPNPGFPSYAQLNAALRNLSPEQLSQDQPSPDFPTYEQLAQALRNLSPPTPFTDASNNGFPIYGQLAAVLHDLRTEPRRSREPRSPRVPRYAALATISEFVLIPRHLCNEAFTASLVAQ
ncbi:hypothetical protein PC123_g21683 [Phytophthora cactorum]|nr:hypothetical protein PC123_g21683 [Phytophthora cactorum]